MSLLSTNLLFIWIWTWESKLIGSKIPFSRSFNPNPTLSSPRLSLSSWKKGRKVLLPLFTYTFFFLNLLSPTISLCFILICFVLCVLLPVLMAMCNILAFLFLFVSKLSRPFLWLAGLWAFHWRKWLQETLFSIFSPHLEQFKILSQGRFYDS